MGDGKRDSYLQGARQVRRGAAYRKAPIQIIHRRGGCDDEVEGKHGHWYGLLRGPFHNIDEIEPGVPLTKEEREYLDRIAGVILCETDAGYIYAYYYEDPAELEKVWEEEVLGGLGEL